LSEEQLREIPNLGSMSVADISAALGDPALGWDDPISERDQELIRMRQQGATLVQVARRFGISKTRVEQILERDGW
jgi:DNA-directed RNA polymerase sigma subunit (sigma70/sigma32)